NPRRGSPPAPRDLHSLSSSRRVLKFFPGFKRSPDRRNLFAARPPRRFANHATALRERIAESYRQDRKLSNSDSSAQAEAFARDNCEPCGKNAVQLGGQNETHANPRRADLQVFRNRQQ